MSTTDSEWLDELFESKGQVIGYGDEYRTELLADLKAEIEQRIREARIDELNKIEKAQQDDDKWSNFCMDDTSDFGNYIQQRVAELTKGKEEGSVA